jgi:hypothetical protein
MKLYLDMLFMKANMQKLYVVQTIFEIKTNAQLNLKPGPGGLLYAFYKTFVSGVNNYKHRINPINTRNYSISKSSRLQSS